MRVVLIVLASKLTSLVWFEKFLFLCKILWIILIPFILLFHSTLSKVSVIINSKSSFPIIMWLLRYSWKQKTVHFALERQRWTERNLYSKVLFRLTNRYHCGEEKFNVIISTLSISWQQHECFTDFFVIFHKTAKSCTQHFIEEKKLDENDQFKRMTTRNYCMKWPTIYSKVLAFFNYHVVVL